MCSFDRTGFRRHTRARPFGPERDLLGRTALITGGTNGIGLAAARGLSDRGASALLWGRNQERGARAAQHTGGHFQSVDLGDLAAVSIAAHAVPDAPLAALVLNAGAMPWKRTLTPQGHELVWASQVLGHALLLRILQSRAVVDSSTRVVWVSSGGMYTQHLDLTDLTREGSYQRHQVYAVAKRAQAELVRCLADTMPSLTLTCMHPGWVDTDAVRHSMPWFRAITRPILRTPEQGADTVVWLCARSEAPESGTFWFDRAQAPLHLSRRTSTSGATDAELLSEVIRATDPFLEIP